MRKRKIFCVSVTRLDLLELCSCFCLPACLPVYDYYFGLYNIIETMPILTEQPKAISTFVPFRRRCHSFLNSYYFSFRFFLSFFLSVCLGALCSLRELILCDACKIVLFGRLLCFWFNVVIQRTQYTKCKIYLKWLGPLLFSIRKTNKYSFEQMQTTRTSVKNCSISFRRLFLRLFVAFQSVRVCFLDSKLLAFLSTIFAIREFNNFKYGIYVVFNGMIMLCTDNIEWTTHYVSEWEREREKGR